MRKQRLSIGFLHFLFKPSTNLLFSMFEAVELGQKVSKALYNKELIALRTRLVQLQYAIKDAPFSVLILVEANHRFGANELLNVLHEWMDPRFLEGSSFGSHNNYESGFPEFWRYWNNLPSHGRIALFLRSWPMDALFGSIRHQEGNPAFNRRIRHIKALEKSLVQNNVLVLKYWLHIPFQELDKHIHNGDSKKKAKWSVHKYDRLLHQNYEANLTVIEEMIQRTSTFEAPWLIVEASDKRYRNLRVATDIATRLEQALEDAHGQNPKNSESVTAFEVGQKNILQTIDLTKEIDTDLYETELKKWQKKLKTLNRKANAKGISSVLLFEGWDASGKGGIIRRLTQAMDAANYRVVPIAAPTQDEKAHHYLWRFWKHLPARGKTQIFDRSWYGRVLVERVEGFASEAEWKRAYSEIGDFEEQIVESGSLFLKFWLHVDKEEQLRRFQEREQTPWKKHKITEEDYRNREKWGEYALAANDMILKTSVEGARWNLVAANDKKAARIHVLKTVCEALEDKL